MRWAARHRPSGRMIGLPSRVADMQYPEWIWHNGTIKPWAEATTHVMSHALHYGSSVFEGIRSYDTPDGPAIRSEEHTSELQSLMRTSYAVFCLKQKNKPNTMKK